jgi:hypothetical protein
VLNAVADGESAEEAQSVAVVLAASAASERENLEGRISALENERQIPMNRDLLTRLAALETAARPPTARS